MGTQCGPSPPAAPPHYRPMHIVAKRLPISATVELLLHLWLPPHHHHHHHRSSLYCSVLADFRSCYLREGGYVLSRFVCLSVSRIAHKVMHVRNFGGDKKQFWSRLYSGLMDFPTLRRNWFSKSRLQFSHQSICVLSLTLILISDLRKLNHFFVIHSLSTYSQISFVNIYT